MKKDVRAAVHIVLRRRNVRKEQFDEILKNFMRQAEAAFADRPLA